MTPRPFDDTGFSQPDPPDEKQHLDLTPQIMQRLGIPPAGSSKARRRRVSRFATRTGLLLVAMGGIAIGLSLYVDAGAARAGSRPTISSALRHDLDSHRRVITGTIESIGRLRPQLPLLLAPAPVVTPEFTPPPAPESRGTRAAPRSDAPLPNGVAPPADAV